MLIIPLTLAPICCDAHRSQRPLTVWLPAFRLRVVVGRLLTGRYLPASLPRGTAGGIAGSAYGFGHMEQLSLRLHVARHFATQITRADLR
jgi:hypothetical protein